jgi:hypothetical protein
VRHTAVPQPETEYCHSKAQSGVTARDTAVSQGQSVVCQGHSGVTARGRAVSKAYNGIIARDIAESHKDSAVSVRDSGVKSETDVKSETAMSQPGTKRCQTDSGVTRNAD